MQKAMARKLKKLLYWVCCLATPIFYFSATYAAVTQTLQYEIKPNDTLLGVAEKLLDDPIAWPEAFSAENAALYPGDILEVTQSDTGTPAIKKISDTSIRLSPTVRSEKIAQAIPAIPMTVVGPFLDGSRILPEKALEQAATIIGFEGERLAMGEEGRFFAKGIAESSAPAKEYDIFAPGEVLVGKDKHILGIHARLIGRARLDHPGDVSTFHLSKIYREVSVGSYLLPTAQQEIAANFLLRHPTQAAKGHILAILDGVNQVGQYHIIIISGGADLDRKPGDLLNIVRSGVEVPSKLLGQLPPGTTYPAIPVGTALVFRVFDKASYALVTKTKDFIHVQDVVEGLTS